VSKFGGDAGVVLFECFRVKPREAGIVHMLQDGGLVVVRDMLLISKVFTRLTELVGKRTFVPVGIEVEANARAVF
jgi:hypothetical protein